jgi:hypothetical protein
MLIGCPFKTSDKIMAVVAAAASLGPSNSVPRYNKEMSPTAVCQHVRVDKVHVRSGRHKVGPNM